jgi:hypothetical protein
VNKKLIFISRVVHFITLCGMFLLIVGVVQTIMTQTIQDLYFTYSGIVFLCAFIIAVSGYAIEQRALYIKRKKAEDIVVPIMALYDAGEITMLEAIAKSGLGVRDFMRVLRELDIQPKFNLGGIEGEFE